MRFRAGNSTVDVVVDIDRFELPITSFLPGITADSIESVRSLLEPGHMDAARSRATVNRPTGIARPTTLVRCVVTGQVKTLRMSLPEMGSFCKPSRKRPFVAPICTLVIGRPARPIPRFSPGLRSPSGPVAKEGGTQ